MLKPVWEIVTSVRLSVCLLFLVSFNFAVGAYYVKGNRDFFWPLNNLPFQQWVRGSEIEETWWFFTLFLLLFLLGINITTCSLQRIVILCRKRPSRPFTRFLLLISPSLMHVGFLVILCGHGLSLFAGEHREYGLRPGDTIHLPGFSLEVGEMRQDFYPQLMLGGRVKQCDVAVLFRTSSSEDTKVLGFLHPVSFNGWRFHLDGLLQSNAPDEGLRARITARKDHGIWWMLSGGVMLSVFLVVYFAAKTIARDE